jgi:glycosyltransferase involved in cell wall biosynthesis
MRVAFSLFGGDEWIGGINYLRNLLSAISELPENPVEAILFIAPNTSPSTVEIMLPFLAKPPVVVQGWNASYPARIKRLLGSAVLQSDFVSERVFRQEKIDVVFQHAAWYGLNFPIPSLVWIADFQHKHLPHMFGRLNNIKRDLGYFALSHCASRVMVSSEDAGRDCIQFFPKFENRISVVRFAVQVSDKLSHISPSDVRKQYQLPERYFYLPNQWWRHKNHLALIESLRILKSRVPDLLVVASGNPKDSRNPDHPSKVLEAVSQYGLENNFRFLGLIPYEHIMPLMRGCLAVINPSLFEGWSTTVEEAKALGVPLLLSGLPVHHEQTAEEARFFNPHKPEEIAVCLEKAWQQLDFSQRNFMEQNAIKIYKEKRLGFARDFIAALNATVKAS